MRRSCVAIVLGAALVVLGIAIGIALLLVEQDEVLSAQEVFQGACTELSITDYDAAITITGSDTGSGFRGEGTMRVSGEDGHLEVTSFAEENSVDGTVEWIWKDNVSYVRPDELSDPSDGMWGNRGGMGQVG